MVKVVGKDLSKIKKVTCKSCASILEYTKYEVQERYGTDWSGGSDGVEWIDCPSCHGKVILRSW
jgi:hypothetical protein